MPLRTFLNTMFAGTSQRFTICLLMLISTSVLFEETGSSAALDSSTWQEQDNESRHPIPDKAKQSATLKKLVSIYGKPGSKKQAEKFATEYLKVAADSDESVEQFVLQQQAMKFAIRGGDIQLAIKSIDALARKFDVSEYELKLDCLKKIAANVSTREMAQNYFIESLHIVSHYEREDQFERCLGLLRETRKKAERAKFQIWSEYLGAELKRVGNLKSSYDKLKVQFARLESSPDNRSANNLIGEFYCLSKGDWIRGLKYLARGNGSLSKIADEEISTNLKDLRKVFEICKSYQQAAGNASRTSRNSIHLHTAGLLYWLISKSKGLKKTEYQAVQSKVLLQTYPASIFSKTWTFGWANNGRWEKVNFNADGTLMIKVVGARAAKKYRWQFTRDGIRINAGTNYYFLLNSDAKGFSGKKFEAKSRKLVGVGRGV